MRRVIASIVGIAASYALFVRPRMLRWGATDAEIAAEYPGRELIPGGYRGATMATTIDAPRERVWPWLLQMGYGRAGWYSWDHLDNWGHASAKELHPEWQDVSLGDKLPSMPDNRTWWEVAALEPERFLGLRASVSLGGKPFDPRGPRPRYFTDSLWGFLLEDAPGGKTRLVVSGYWALSPRWLLPIASVLLLEPSHWIMQMRQFANLRRLVEGDSTGSQVAAPSRAQRTW
jgi:proline iminopeptidase